MKIVNKSNQIYPWVVVGLLWIVALLNYMDRQMLSTMRTPIMVDIFILLSFNTAKLLSVL